MLCLFHFAFEFVIKLKVEGAFVDALFEFVAFDEVRRSEALRNRVGLRLPHRYDPCNTVAVVRDFPFAFAVDGLQHFVQPFSRINFDFPLFDDVNAFVAEGLIKDVVGVEESVRESEGDGALELFAPTTEEEKGGLYD